MKTIQGAYTSAQIFTTDNKNTAVEPYALAQIQMICNQKASAGCRVRVMPDVHPGKIGPVGLTMTVGEKIMPGLIGPDIGCGISLARIKAPRIDCQKLDSVIREYIPVGFMLRSKAHSRATEFDFSALRCSAHIRTDKPMLSLGTLGGGNHFLEADRDMEGNLYLAVHSGSRSLGKEILSYYLNEGQKRLKEQSAEALDSAWCRIRENETGRIDSKKAATTEAAAKESSAKTPYELTWLEGDLRDDYLHDLQIVQQFASLNRRIILDEIMKRMKWKQLDFRECIHNYVDDSAETVRAFHAPVLRKGAISAKAGEQVLIPVNMRDGILLGTGLGNPDWNCSAPHGSGRILNRTETCARFTLSAFKTEMKGIYSSCIRKDTLDEAPFAYRPLGEIAEAITDTVKVDCIIRPVYSFKAGGDG